MNTASKYLAKSLYEESGWRGTRRFLYINLLFKYPIYTLSYLIKIMPQHVKVQQENNGQYYNASHSRIEEEGGYYYVDSRTPEDAMTELAIQLFRKGGVLK